MSLEKFTGGLPGGANQLKLSRHGYQADSPDRNNPYNVIPSGDITMDNVPHPVLGIDNQGNEQMMYPGQNYQFPGNMVTEFPQAQYGAQIQTGGGYNYNELASLKEGGINIKPSKRGTFTAAATKRGIGVQEFASRVMGNKDNYSPAMVKKANFARNAAKWNKQDGGEFVDLELDDKQIQDLRDKGFTVEDL